MAGVSRIRSVGDAEFLARRRIPRGLVQQIEGGSGLGSTLADNLGAFEEVGFSSRVGVSFGARGLATTVLGNDVAIPVLIAPMAHLRVYHRDGELGIARAADAMGTIACISTFTGYAIEEVTAASSAPIFFQLYYVGGRENVEAMIDRARRAGVKALMVTLDTAGWYQRERKTRSRRRAPTSLSNRRATLRFAPQALARPRWLAGFVRDGMRVQTPMVLHPDGRPYELPEARFSMLNAAPVWEDLAWIGERFGGPVIVKGILSPDDARRAVAAGAAAILVSNHGGNALDGLPAALRALPPIVDAVGSQIEVLMDSGIRRGTDVVKALALGARAVLIGRACLWAHAAAGGRGVTQMLQLLHHNIDQTLALLGCESIDQLGRSHLRIPASWATELSTTAPPQIIARRASQRTRLTEDRGSSPTTTQLP